MHQIQERLNVLWKNRKWLSNDTKDLVSLLQCATVGLTLNDDQIKGIEELVEIAEKGDAPIVDFKFAIQMIRRVGLDPWRGISATD